MAPPADPVKLSAGHLALQRTYVKSPEGAASGRPRSGPAQAAGLGKAVPERIPSPEGATYIAARVYFGLFRILRRCRVAGHAGSQAPCRGEVARVQWPDRRQSPGTSSEAPDRPQAFWILGHSWVLRTGFWDLPAIWPLDSGHSRVDLCFNRKNRISPLRGSGIPHKPVFPGLRPYLYPDLFK